MTFRATYNPWYGEPPLHALCRLADMVKSDYLPATANVGAAPAAESLAREAGCKATKWRMPPNWPIRLPTFSRVSAS